MKIRAEYDKVSIYWAVKRKPLGDPRGFCL